MPVTSGGAITGSNEPANFAGGIFDVLVCLSTCPFWPVTMPGMTGTFIQ
ncbi:hypothetical protein HMPREF0880_04187 [Yokenella regensburgei ATCC 43003]|nr:hypothetical protein HMPREF0880_04187 [Yokenella regensburgei ATCC 43003]